MPRPWYDGEHGILYGLERYTILCPGEPVGVAEALKDRVLALDASIVCVAYGADDISDLVDAQNVGKPEISALLQVFVVEGGLEAGHDRSPVPRGAA